MEELMKIMMADDMSENIHAPFNAEFRSEVKEETVTSMKCCKKVRISSTKFASQEYPHMLGTYENVNEDPARRPTYK